MIYLYDVNDLSHDGKIWKFQTQADADAFVDRWRAKAAQIRKFAHLDTDGKRPGDPRIELARGLA